MKISINSVNFLEFFASFLYDTGKLFQIWKIQTFSVQKTWSFYPQIRLSLWKTYLLSCFCSWYTLYCKKERIRSYEFNSDQTHSLPDRQNRSWHCWMNARRRSRSTFLFHLKTEIVSCFFWMNQRHLQPSWEWSFHRMALRTRNPSNASPSPALPCADADILPHS